MPSTERSSSRDSERRHLKHKHSASDFGRAIVPMWDSSDPERAPPPLPMNPSSPGVTSRPNTSAAIQSAHAALTEKARESAYVTNPPMKRIETSPERSLIKGAAHKRMQSLHTGNVRDISSFLEGSATFGPSRSPEKGTQRPSTPHAQKDFVLEARSPDKETNRSTTPTQRRDSLSVRPSLRRPPQSILGENTPPQSSTMLALQAMASRDADAPLANVTNGSTALVRNPQTFDAISNQILSLTSIATSLQRDMANLSRRSKDNATDLVSLKEATNARDEDIRKSLRELVTNLAETSSRPTNPIGYGSTGLYLDSKAHNNISPGSRSVKSFALPRIPSPNSFAASLDRESLITTPSVYNHDSAASIALLEKVLREMGTKEGQDLLISRLTEVADRLSRDGMSTAKKLEDLVQFIKANNTSQELMANNIGGGGGNGNYNRPRNFSYDEGPRLELNFDGSRSAGPLTSRVESLFGQDSNKENIRASDTSRAAGIINEDILKIIRTVKDSVAQGGGLTAEVKALVRELRGEVLGMGREIGRKLDQANTTEDGTKDTEAEKEHVARVVQDGLEELKVHMDRVLRENRRQSAGSNKSVVDYEEIYNAVRSAISDKSQEQEESSLNKHDIITAVKEAWENYKPEIELQHFGLEREELLACLKEGISEYAPQDSNREVSGATREEVFLAVIEGLKHFSPPQVETDTSLSREEILDAVRECLEEFEFPSAPPPEHRETDITRDDVFEAITEGLNNFDFSANQMVVSRDVGPGLTRDDMFDAVKAGLGEASMPIDGFGEQVIERLQEVMDVMRTEFMGVSEEAKNNVAAHGRDTEQLLDATKDGFEKLRTDIETYVDQVAQGGGKEDILDSLREGFDTLRLDVEVLISKGSNSSMESVQGELQHLRESMATSLIRADSTLEKDEIIDALREGIDALRIEIEQPRADNEMLESMRDTLESLRLDIEQPRSNTEILNALREGLEALRADLEHPRAITNESDVSGSGEILDALHEGVTDIRSEIEKIGSKVDKPVEMDMTVNYEILDSLKAGFEAVRADVERLRNSDHIDHGDRAMAAITSGAVIPVEEAAEGLKRNDIENLEVLITQLRIKVEALESMPPAPTPPTSSSFSKADLVEVEEMLRNVHDVVTGISSRDQTLNEDAATKEDFVALETLLHNTKAKIDDMDPEELVKKVDINSLEASVLETKDGVHGLASHLDDLSKRDDVAMVESLVKEVLTGLAEIRERAVNDSEDLEKVSKTDVEAVESVCLDIKTSIEQMVLTDMLALASKDDVKNLEELVKEFTGRIETHAETNAKAFEERQAETVGVGERVTEIKGFLEEFKDAIKEKLDEGATSVEALGKFLESLSETIGQNVTITDDIREMSDTMKSEFEKSHAGVVGCKLESDEKFQQTWDKFESKLDEKFNEIMTKYDDAQIVAESRAKTGEERMSESEEAMLGTKAVAEDLRSIIETLGCTLTDSVEKMDEASKTVFNKVEDTFTRVEETHADAKAEHQLTREQVFKTLGAVEGVHGHVTEYHPKILESIKDILLIVGQHYEHSKTSAETIQGKIADIPPPAPPVEIPLLEPPVVEKYDDGQVHEKLDKLVDHIQSSSESAAKLNMLDKIHQQVMQTAAEVSDFVSAQTQRIADDHEDKERAVEAATIALEKRIAQKEHVEASVVGLREEEELLKESVAILKAEQEDLAHQKMRLSADVSSLETALNIRREELHAMETRAEGLERRILEGVIDHSRALLLTKTNKGRDAMSRKRVPSQATSTTGSLGSSVTSRASYTTQSAISMAMSGNRAMVSVPINKPAGAAPGAARRILSLNQITNNVPAGNFKRSHSVKQHVGSGALRKSSWGGSTNGKYGDLNKENLALKESEQEDESEGVESESGTMRRSSRGTTIMTGTGASESIDEGTEWTGSIDGESSLEEEPAPMVLFEEAAEVA